MHFFHYKKNRLHCESVPVAQIAEAVGTPCYIYSLETVLDHYKKLVKAFESLDPLICFSTKANSNLTLLKTLTRAGAGLDIVSGGELVRAQKVGCDPKKIVYASVGKTPGEIREAIRSKILMFNVESMAELEAINRAACQLKTRQKIAIRLNPDVTPGTHHYITTGSRQNKFGLDFETAYKLFMESYRYPYLTFAGVHIHIGSQITDSRPFIEAVSKALRFIDSVSYAGNPVEYLNIGGGLGIVYSKEKPQTAEAFASKLMPLFRSNRRLKLILEPGRFIVGNAGILVTRMLFEKRTREKIFWIVDAGMNDLIRPAFYGAHHEIWPVNRLSKTTRREKVDLVGPICESGDFLAKERLLARARPGDLLAVMSCGAYGFVMSSNYNSRPRVPEVAVRGRRFEVVRRREKMSDLLAAERIATGLLS